MSQVTVQSVLIEQIKLYYLKSFRTCPEELFELFMRILDSHGQLSAVAGHGPKLNKLLTKMMHAQQRKDYVAIRDILWYEIKPYFEMKKG